MTFICLQMGSLSLELLNYWCCHTESTGDKVCLVLSLHSYDTAGRTIIPAWKVQPEQQQQHCIIQQEWRPCRTPGSLWRPRRTPLSLCGVSKRSGV